MPVQTIVRETSDFKGQNTAVNPTYLQEGQQRKALNAVMRSNGSIAKRDGSIPVTAEELDDAIQYLTVYKQSPSSVNPDLLATAGTTLYKFDGTDTLTAQTMTDDLETADIYSVGFTDANSISILFITDGGDVKQYDGTEVANIVPAVDDGLPLPPNDLTNINALGPIYCWVHSSHVFVATGKDIVFYSKRFTFDYFPSVQFERWVRNNDYITGPGVTFNNVCLIPMRRGWGILTGSVFNDGDVSDGFNGNQFLNTVNGCVAPHSIQRVSYPDGRQTIVYLSDDGVYEVYDTGFEDTGSRQYSTFSLMDNKIDFNAVGFTEDEKKAASGYFDQENNQYILIIKKNLPSEVGIGRFHYAYVYDTRNREWYLWDNFVANSAVRYNGNLYYGGQGKDLMVMSSDLYSDWDQPNRVSGTPIDFDVISGLIAFEFTGYASYLDYYVLEAKQWLVPASIDVYIVYGASIVPFTGEQRFINEIAMWGVSEWGSGVWANINFTEIINQAARKIIKKKGKYFQRRWRNNRDEPVEIYKERFYARGTGR